MDKFLTVTQTAVLFNVSRQTVYNWVRQGRFPNVMTVGEGRGEMFLIPPEDVELVRKEEMAKVKERLGQLQFRSVSA